MLRVRKRQDGHMTGVEVAAIPDEWSLRDQGKARGPWRRYKLVANTTVKLPKRTWAFDWDGKRLAKSRDVLLLLTHNPITYEWVFEELRRLAPKS